MIINTESDTKAKTEHNTTICKMPPYTCQGNFFLFSTGCGRTVTAFELAAAVLDVVVVIVYSACPLLLIKFDARPGSLYRYYSALVSPQKSLIQCL